MNDPGDEPFNAADDDVPVQRFDEKGPDVPVRMTLEQIIDLTGQLEHLNELILLHLRNNGGFTCTESYFTTVQPVLDMLEVEIRFRYRPGMTTQQITLIVQDWIDREIAAIQKVS
jgi:hypothetical protein